mgnify:CR=1 FL=1
MRLIEPLCLCVIAAALIALPAQAQTPPSAPAAAVAPSAPAPRTWQRYEQTNRVQLRDVAAFVRITPENRTDILVAVHNPGPLPAPTFRIARDRLMIDGRLRRQFRGCRVVGPGFEVTTARQGRLNTEQLPVIDLRVPQNAVVSASGAVRLRMGPSQTADVALNGCGDADIERVADEAEISLAGSPDLRLHDAGTATIAVAGAGDITAGVIRNGLTISIAGAGDFVAARADGPTSIAIQGSGDVTIRDGRATTLSVVIAGAGDVFHNGSAEQLDAVILGAGDVRVRHVEGEVTRRVIGGGEVVVGR